MTFDSSLGATSTAPPSPPSSTRTGSTGGGTVGASAAGAGAAADPPPAPLPNVTARRAASAYVHFPWCLAKCPYCDFVSYVAPAIDHAGYADAVLRELDARAPAFMEGHVERRLESVFFGGGTPSLWEPAELGGVLDGLRARFGARSTAEVTVECNPTSLDVERARRLRDAGVNRLSIGVQSLRDDRLRYLGRLHDAAGARSAVEGAIASGIPRVSADLIFGLPGQSASDARDEAIELVNLGVAHLSCYQLTIEPGTRFGELARRGRLPLAEDGEVADAFLAIDEALGGLGFRHYEISNYARPGEEARHNLGYWRGDEYLGLGCGAYGFVRSASATAPAAGLRWRNEVQPDRYVASGAQSPGATVESLDAETLLRERIMLGLRVEEGIDLDAIARDLRVDPWSTDRQRAVAWLEQRGRLERSGPRLRVPRAAWLWTDDTAARLF
jgi:putative oxygen-independent coproporphyrinogen III oxidase